MVEAPMRYFWVLLYVFIYLYYDDTGLKTLTAGILGQRLHAAKERMIK